ncbi:CD276 antigen homolog [Chanos chanos]|uniref:CD276 antigen homolog n=1 Tax=Chanos chanos TaxID=29144 RepID=A0A6J2W4Y9_CHACN|nr:CD276 antigen homolog [Chanos chanos]
MVGRWVLIYLLVLYIDKVFSSQDVVTVDGVTGGSVILPCIYTDEVIKTEDLTVYWRLNDSMVVYEHVSDGTGYKPDPQFENRTRMFPEMYSTGNFSLSLGNVSITDGGLYSCFILPVNVEKKIELRATEAPAEKTDRDDRNSSVKIGPVSSLLLFLMLLFRHIVLFM